VLFAAWAEAAVPGRCDNHPGPLASMVFNTASLTSSRFMIWALPRLAKPLYKIGDNFAAGVSRRRWVWTSWSSASSCATCSCGRAGSGETCAPTSTFPFERSTASAGLSRCSGAHGSRLLAPPPRRRPRFTHRCCIRNVKRAESQATILLVVTPCLAPVPVPAILRARSR
jgi:hypothetical protein